MNTLFDNDGIIKLQKFEESTAERVQRGDILLLKVKDMDCYFYAKVLCDKVKSKIGAVDGSTVVALYRNFSKQEEIPQSLKEKDILGIYNLKLNNNIPKELKILHNKRDTRRIDFGFRMLKPIEEREESLYSEEDSQLLIKSDEGKCYKVYFRDTEYRILNHVPKYKLNTGLCFMKCFRTAITDYLIKEGVLSSQQTEA